MYITHTKCVLVTVSIAQSTDLFKKSLKIPKGYLEAVNRSRTDNTMVKRKRTNDDLQYTSQTTKDRATRIPPTTDAKLRCSGRIGSP